MAPRLQRRLPALLLASLLSACAIGRPAEDAGPSRPAASAYTGPIIDVHLHAFEWDRYGPEPPPNPASGRRPEARSDEAAARASLEALARHRVVKAVASGPGALQARWRRMDPERILPGVYADDPEDLPPVEEVRRLAAAGDLAVLGELGPQYAGGTLGDPGWQPYLALAEEIGLPVAVHTGVGPPRTPHTCCPDFRTHLGRPGLLEEVLVRYPDLKLLLMHAGMPWLEETLALLHVYPGLHLDLAVVDWILPRAQFHAYLKALLDAGFEDRLLFGSDQMIWPDAIGLAIEGVDSAPFLRPDQKRKIFHDNAARFLSLE